MPGFTQNGSSKIGRMHALVGLDDFINKLIAIIPETNDFLLWYEA